MLLTCWLYPDPSIAASQCFPTADTFGSNPDGVRLLIENKTHYYTGEDCCEGHQRLPLPGLKLEMMATSFLKMGHFEEQPANASNE